MAATTESVKTKSSGYSYLIFIALALSILACASNPELIAAQNVITKLTPAATKLVDFGLTVSGNGEIVPLNDAGSAALQVLQKSISTPEPVPTGK